MVTSRRSDNVNKVGSSLVEVTGHKASQPCSVHKVAAGPLSLDSCLHLQATTVLRHLQTSAVLRVVPSILALLRIAASEVPGGEGRAEAWQLFARH